MTINGPAFLSLNRFGKPTDDGVVTLKPQEKPKATPGHIVVKMKYATINPSDLFVASGAYVGAKCVQTNTLPSKLGFEGAGVIEEVGEGVPEAVFRVGDPIIPLVGSSCGSWASYVMVPATSAIPVPRDCLDIPFEYLAQVFVNPLTVLAMFQESGIQPGQYFLQTAANSSLGRMMIQIAKQKGYRSINIVRRPELVKELKESEGGDFVFSYPHDDIIEKTREMTDGKGVPFVFDAVGGDMGAKAIQCLAEHGKAIVYGLQSGDNTPFSGADLLFKGCEIKWFWLQHWAMKQGQGMQQTIGELFTLIKQGIVKPNVEKAYPLKDFKDAFEEQLNSKNGRKGKLLFSLDN